MKDIMTAEEYYNSQMEIVFYPMDESKLHKIMEAYAHYYAQALIEGLTDEHLQKACDLWEHKATAIGGAIYAREELLKRNDAN